MRWCPADIHVSLIHANMKKLTDEIINIVATIASSNELIDEA